MRFLRCLLSLIAFLAPIGLAAADAPVDDVSTRIATALESRSLDAFLPLTDGGHEATGPLRELMERHQCIEVSSARMVADADARYRLRLDGVAFTARGRAVPLPPEWIVEFVEKDGRQVVSSLATAEHRLAWRVGAITDRVTRQKLTAAAIAEGSVDAARFAIQLAEWTVADIPKLAFTSELAEEALAIARAANDRRAEALALRSLATVVRLSEWTDRHERAHALVDEGLAVASEAGDPDSMAMLYFASGLTSWMEGKPAEAQVMLRAVGDLAGELDDPRIAMKALYMNAYLDQLAGRMREVIVTTDRLGELARRYRWSEGELQAANVRAVVYTQLRMFDAAIAQLHHALAISEATHNAFVASFVLHNLATAHHGKGEYDVAQGYAVRAANTDVSTIPREYVAIFAVGAAAAEVKRNCLAEAEQMLARAELSPSLSGATRSTIATVGSALELAAGRPDAALALARSAIEHEGGTVVVFPVQWPARLAAARALRALGRPLEAIADLEAAVEEIEAIRADVPAGEMVAAPFLRDRVAPYSELVELLVARGDVRGAFAIAEKMKGRALRDAVTQGNVDISTGLTAEERAEEQALLRRVAEAKKRLVAATGPEGDEAVRELARARTELDELTGRLYLKHPRLSTRRGSEVEEAEVVKLLQGRSAIEYAVGDEQTIAFAVTAAGSALRVEAWRIDVTRTALEAAVSRLVQKLGGRDLGYRTEATRLYDLLLGGAPRGVTNGDLLIVPDDVLWRLPFHVLRGRDGRDVLETAAISYAPSLGVAALSRPRRTTRPATILAFGDPTLGATARRLAAATAGAAVLPALPDAAMEARTVASFYAGAAEVQTGRSARESRFKSEAWKASILHLAMHGLLDDRAPMYSALLMAEGGGSGDDGFLEAREVLDLELHADVAVLSACETARGSWGAGEGVIGMSWSFLVAGCRATVVNQWRAPSKATSALMIEFHRRFSKGATAPHALRDAQLTLRRDPRYAHPFYWAGFAVIGAP